MVTGDNIFTAKAVAKECGFLFDDDNIVIEGKVFRHLPQAEMDRIIPNLRILARSSPEDKVRLIKRLKELSEIVAAIGDQLGDATALVG
jgi:Ca2+-transporting ATPase